VFTVLSNSQVIGCEYCLRNDLYCVGWGVKLYSTHHSQMSPLVSTYFQQFCGTLFAVCVVGKLLYSSSTWWAIVAQYKDFKKSRESRPLLTTTVLQTATFSY